VHIDDSRKSLIATWADKTIRESVNLTILAHGAMVKCSCGDKHALGNTEWLDTLKTYIGRDGPLVESVVTMAVKWYCPAELLKEIKYPDGIIESLKDKWLPTFARPWWPVRYCVHKVYEMYPEVKFPNHIGTRYIYFGKEYDPESKQED